jgi:hypothetical protein
MSIHRYLGSRFERYTGDGFKLTSRRGWFYLGLRTRVYVIHIGLGRLAITFETKRERNKR